MVLSRRAALWGRGPSHSRESLSRTSMFRIINRSVTTMEIENNAIQIRRFRNPGGRPKHKPFSDALRMELAINCQGWCHRSRDQSGPGASQRESRQSCWTRCRTEGAAVVTFPDGEAVDSRNNSKSTGYEKPPVEHRFKPGIQVAQRAPVTSLVKPSSRHWPTISRGMAWRQSSESGWRSRKSTLR